MGNYLFVGVFLFGAIGYPLLELIFRGRTHYSMALAGGFSILWLYFLYAHTVYPLWLKCAFGAIGITLIELFAGFVFNRTYKVWDYRNVRFSYKGQICLPYTLLWGLLCLPVFMMFSLI